ncbi:MAG TPA: hypothetical protein VGD56_05655 [Gemmatirosa sp.]
MWTSSSRRRVARGVARGVAAIALLPAALVLAPVVVRAQSSPGYHDQLAADDLGGVIVTVYVPDSNAEIDAGSRTMLRTRIGSILSSGGLAGVGVETPFVMYPLVAVVDDVVSDGGLERMTVAKVEVSFVLRHVASRSVIDQWTGTVTGSGRDRAGAVRNALSNISASDPRLAQFATEARARVVNYYEQHCSGIRAQARAAAHAGRTDEAYANLLAVPGDARSCQAAAARDAEQIMRPGAGPVTSVQLSAVHTQHVEIGAQAGAGSAGSKLKVAAYFNKVDAHAVRFDFIH